MLTLAVPILWAYKIGMPSDMLEKSKRGRPTVDSELLRARMERPLINALDAWIAAQPDPRPTRPEAIRRLLEKSLRSWPTGVELEHRITEVKQQLAVPDIEEGASPAKGMEMLRRGHAENELRTLRRKRIRSKPGGKV